MELLTLIPYHTETIDLPVSKEEAEQLLEISSDPENENAQLVTSKSPDDRWLLARRPGTLNNLLLVLGRVRLQADEDGACRAEVSIGLQPLVSVVVVLVLGVLVGVFVFINLKPLISIFALGATALVFTLSVVLEDRFLRKTIRKMLTFDP